ncbi:Tape measure protein [Popillia japonica]|uniref:Tape measure protein n=1 Tax=Popillia japonica TaxID=7064 RepID=A0AAW1HVL1_POPJA
MADYTLSAKITGDASGFEKAAKSAQSSLSNMQSKFSSIGKGISGLGNSITSAGNTLTNSITKPALAATTALVGVTLVKGFNRLVGIDSAQAKLKALGHDADSVTNIMNSALESVKGTAFGLDEAATTAANAVAAGIKPGQELTRYLSLTADAAAIAETSLADMGHVFNQVQTSQTAYTDDLNQLADKGLPIYQWLAEEAGVAASEVKQLASEGKISSEMLLSAVEKNIGGAAKIMGEESFAAAVANIGASIGRIGAKFLDAEGTGGGFFSSMKPLLAEFNQKLEGVEVKAEEMGRKFGDAFNNVVSKIREVKATFDGLDASTQQTILKIATIGPAVAVGIGPALKIIGPLITLVGGLFTGISTLMGGFAGLGTAIQKAGGIGSAFGKVIGAITSPVGIVIAAIVGLVAAFAYLMSTNEEFRNSIIGSFQTIITSLAPILSTLGNLIQGTIAAVLPVITSTLQTLAPVIATIVGLIAQVVAGVAPLIAQLIGSLLPVIQTVVGVVGNVLTALMPGIVAILNVVMSVLQAAIPIITDILSVVVSVVAGIISAISPVVSFIGGIISAIVSVITPIVTFIANIISSIITVIGTVIGAVTGTFNTVFSVVSGVFSNISSFIAGVINAVSGIISTLSGVVSGVFNGIYSVASSVMSRVGSFITGIFNGIKSAWNGLTSFVSGVFSGISSAVSTLVNTVKGFVNGVIGGINSAIGLINMIPGVSIGSIPYLLHGTDDWAGGFARMNEGGRGELTYLPNGTTVIPHDISVQYAKESARANANGGQSLDLGSILEGVVIAINNSTNVDGTPLMEMASEYTIEQIGNQRNSYAAVRGV